MSSSLPLHVLFLCTHNSARSILAEAAMNTLGGGRVVGLSAGSQPSGRVNPTALKVLSDMGYDTAHLSSKTWDAFAEPGAPSIDYIFTVCDNAANETCPVWPGHPTTAHWGLPDPSAVTGSEAERCAAFKDTYDKLATRIKAFMALPLQDLDRETLRAKLNAIGEHGSAVADPKA